MVWFTFSFLLGIPNNIQENSKKKEQPENENNYVEIEVSKPCFSCHIEYILMPNESPKFIDIICWDNAVKIFSEDSTSAIMPLVIEKLNWIHFRVTHHIKFATQDIPVFQRHNVKFTVSLGNKKFREAAKSDKTKKFFGPKFSESSEYSLIKKQLFQPLSETLENLQQLSYFKDHLTRYQQLYISLDTTIETSENYNLLHKALEALSNEYIDEDAIRLPGLKFEDPPSLRNILKPEKNVDKDEKKRKEKGADDKKKKGNEGGEMEFSVSGENLLSGRTYHNCLKYKSTELPYIFITCEAKNVMNTIQARLFNPLTIVLKHMKYLPVDQLQKIGVTSLKFQYLICNELLAESNLIDISDEVELNYSRTIFTDTIDKNQLIYFLQTGGLKIDVFGYLPNYPKNSKPNLFHENLELNFMRNNECSKSQPNDKFLLLGTAFIDISPILFQPHRLLLKYNFTMPKNNSGFLNRQNPCDPITTNEFNSSLKKEKALNLDHYFNLSGTVLTVFVSLGYPITQTCQTVVSNPKLFNRLFAVIYDTNLALSTVKLIQEHASEFIEPVDYTKNGINVRRPLSAKNLGNFPSFNYMEDKQITGFLIDCFDKTLLYVESSVCGGIQKLWSHLSSMHPCQGRILYDSSLIFIDRLYEKFFKYGGIFTVTLKENPEVILSTPDAYVRGNLPEPALKALTCLNSLTVCKSIKTATRNNLFPVAESLYSLAIEFGVSVQMSGKVERF